MSKSGQIWGWLSAAMARASRRKPLARLRVAHQRRRQDLDRDGPVEARVVGLVDLAHAPGADRRGDLVGAQAGAFAEQHRRGCGTRSARVEPPTCGRRVAWRW